MKYAITFAVVVAQRFGGSSAFVQPKNNYRSPQRSKDNRRQSRLYGGLEPLATEGDWTAYLDEQNTGLVYYFNGKTGVSVWEKPTSSFPDVVLRGSMKRSAAEIQEVYLKSVADSNPNLKKGFFQSIMDASTADAKSTATTEVKRDDTDWFSPIYEQSTTATPATLSTDVAKIDETIVKDTRESKSESNTWKIGSFLDASQPVTEKPKDNKGFFDILFGGDSGSSSATKDEKAAPSKIEIKDEEPTIDVGGLLGNFFSAATSILDVPTSATSTTTTITATKTPIKVESTAYVLPHPTKIFWGGEDAVFVKGRTFGVFDGVSGAKKLDGIPLYSKTLAKEMKRLIPDDRTALSTPELTRTLAECAEIANQIATGASTAVVASIGDDGFLRAVNVGDSTCIVVRNGKIVATTKEKVHYFECPYQLSADSPDRPKDGTKLNVELMPGDIVFMASDGVFDNLYEADVAAMIVKDKKQLSQLAKRVSDMSRKVSQDPNAKTPYAVLAQRYGDPDYQNGFGGKVDDVSCVVVAYG